MSVLKNWLLGEWYTTRQLVHQQWHRPGDSNKHLDIKYMIFLFTIYTERKIMKTDMFYNGL